MQKTKWPGEFSPRSDDLYATAGPVYHLISCNTIVISEHYVRTR